MWRIIVSLLFALPVALGLFRTMEHMTQERHRAPVVTDNYNYIDFVRLQPEPRKKLKKPKPPQKPEPPPKPPPPVKRARRSFEKPRLKKLTFPVAQLDIPLHLSSCPTLRGVTYQKVHSETALPEDEGIIPLVRLAPVYPYRARRDGIEGWVDLEFTITTTGLVKDIRVVGSKPRRVFDKAAKMSLSKWRFKPKIENGQPVEQIARQKMDFVLDT